MLQGGLRERLPENMRHGFQVALYYAPTTGASSKTQSEQYLRRLLFQVALVVGEGYLKTFTLGGLAADKKALRLQDGFQVASMRFAGGYLKSGGL